MELERIPAVEDIYRDIAREVDAETCFWSGNFPKSRGFQVMLEQGELALPFLLEQIAEDDRAGFWWRAEIIWTVAYDMGKPIPFDEDDLGGLDYVRETTLAWGQEAGFFVPSKATLNGNS